MPDYDLGTGISVVNNPMSLLLAFICGDKYT